MRPEQLPRDWQAVLAAEFVQPYFLKLQQFVAEQRAQTTVYPPAQEVFRALEATPFERVNVVLLGQDPYHGPGQAHGMCFSVRPGVKPPPSLVNLLNELHADLGCTIPRHGCLQAWADRGVLLLNAVLTVRAGEANSHKGQGWERFTDAVIRALDARSRPVVFALWGNYARKKARLLTGRQHRVVQAAHPSPLSAARFMGSRPFSAINAALREVGHEPLDWQLPLTAA